MAFIRLYPGLVGNPPVNSRLVISPKYSYDSTYIRVRKISNLALSLLTRSD